MRITKDEIGQLFQTYPIDAFDSILIEHTLAVQVGVNKIDVSQTIDYM